MKIHFLDVKMQDGIVQTNTVNFPGTNPFMPIRFLQSQASNGLIKYASATWKQIRVQGYTSACVVSDSYLTNY